MSDLSKVSGDDPPRVDEKARDLSRLMGGLAGALHIWRAIKGQDHWDLL